MSVWPYRDIHRRACRKIHVGKVPVGGDAPITVQSMTNTVTSDVKATVEQVQALERAGADIVRVSCPDQESALALKHIVRQVTVPIVADIHFHFRRAIEAAESGAACLRINPGNIGSAERVREVIKAAKDHGCSMRIGVNAGSLERDLLEKYGEPCPEAMVESALSHAKILEDNDFFEFKISCKASDVFLAVAAYQQLAEACDYPLHLGITEAGGLRSGTVKSSIGLGMLLWSGIGDTIRVSLSADPVEEIRVGYDMLKSLGLRRRGVTVISCPSCARQNFDVIKTVGILEERLAHITTPMTLSVIGCVVNGPGEARETDIGFTGGGNNTHQVYLSGVQAHRLKNEDIVQHLVKLVEEMATPIFEFTEVFARGVGETTDIVAKEMYTFVDKGGEEVTLRPENTAGVVRAVLSNGLTQAAPLKYFYAGPMFRYERPQKGRFRQFHQIGVELLGVAQPQADIEVIALGQRILGALGIADKVVLELNTLGDPQSRAAYRDALVAYFSARLSELSEDSRRRLERNPLRILDSKDPGDQRIALEAPDFAAYLNEASRAFFARVRDDLDRVGIAYRLNPRLVRGLDYYTHTVFEFVTTDLGAQGTVLAGGRYDGLVELMGGPAMPGAGWAAGIERPARVIAAPAEPAPP